MPLHDTPHCLYAHGRLSERPLACSALSVRLDIRLTLKVLNDVPPPKYPKAQKYNIVCTPRVQLNIDGHVRSMPPT